MKFRTRPAVVEAMQFTGDNYDEVLRFTGLHYLDPEPQKAPYGDLIIETADGRERTAHPGDWIIRTDDDSCPCPLQIFGATYEPGE